MDNNFQRQLEKWQKDNFSFVINNILNQTQDFDNNPFRKKLEDILKDKDAVSLRNHYFSIITEIQYLLTSQIDWDKFKTASDMSDEDFISFARDIIKTHQE